VNAPQIPDTQLTVSVAVQPVPESGGRVLLLVFVVGPSQFMLHWPTEAAGTLIDAIRDGVSKARESRINASYANQHRVGILVSELIVDRLEPVDLDEGNPELLAAADRFFDSRTEGQLILQTGQLVSNLLGTYSLRDHFAESSQRSVYGFVPITFHAAGGGIARPYPRWGRPS